MQEAEEVTVHHGTVRADKAATVWLEIDAEIRDFGRLRSRSFPRLSFFLQRPCSATSHSIDLNIFCLRFLPWNTTLRTGLGSLSINPQCSPHPRDEDSNRTLRATAVWLTILKRSIEIALRRAGRTARILC